MKNNKKLLKQHATRYIEAVYADALKRAGFVCPDDDLLCWYRLQSAQIVNSIIFYTRWSSLPVLLDIGYGIIPLFEMPLRIKGVVFNKQIEEEILTNPLNGRIEGAKTIFLDDVQAYAPLGSRTLEVILPEMNRIQTIEEAYSYHKNLRLNDPTAKSLATDGYGKWGPLSRTMINMALWLDDQEMYPHAIFTADRNVAIYDAICRKHPNKTECCRELESWQRLQKVLKEGTRDAYIAELSRRVEINTQLVKARYLCPK